MFLKLYSIEIQINYFIQNYRTELLDKFFLFLNFFDTATFYLILISFLLIFISRKWGLRVLFLIFSSSVINVFCKILFNQPRPFMMDPSLTILPLMSNGFPSGATSSAMLLSGLLISQFPKKIIVWFIGVGYLVLISFSRLYLGVHFLSDVIGGWILGFIILATFLKFSKAFEKFIVKNKKAFFFAIQVIPCLLFAIPDFRIFWKVFLALIAFGLGITLSERYGLAPLEPNFPKIKKVVIGLLGILLIVPFILSKKLEPFGYYLFGFWLSFGYLFVTKIFCRIKKS